jgi:L-threonylcarbamoyladenylate synthase
MFFRPADLVEIAKRLKNGDIGLFPCDTIWGLIGSMTAESAAKINKIKQRQTPQPFILLAQDTGVANSLGHFAPEQSPLIDFCWPGPVTLITTKTDLVPDYITAGAKTVGLRVPDSAALLVLLNLLGAPLISSSANITNQRIPKNKSHISADIKSQADFFFDKIEPFWGNESTIINCSSEVLTVCREGAHLPRIKAFIESSSFEISGHPNLDLTN